VLSTQSRRPRRQQIKKDYEVCEYEILIVVKLDLLERKHMTYSAVAHKRYVENKRKILKCVQGVALHTS
jgi:hypothetical protein